MRPPVLLAVLGILLAGCTSAPPPEDTTAPSFAPAGVEAADEQDPSQADGSGPAPDAHAPDTAPAPPSSPSSERPPHVDVAVLEPGAGVSYRLACPGACPDVPFFFVAGEGALLEVLVRWNGTLTRGVALELAAPGGKVLPGERGFDAARVLVDEPEAGDYLVRAGGVADVDLLIRAWTRGAPRGPGGDLLPNLVTLVPSDVGVAECDPWEQVEQEAAKCLRLGNGIGNAGDGPLEVALSPEQGLATPLGDGKFVQHIFQAKGEPREAPVGAAAFHPTHAHFHYDGLARFALHPVDAATGLRGAAVATHHKAGFCLLDIGEMEERDVEPETEGGRRAEQACLVPGGAEGWTMGVSRGFYDYYGAGLTDQYVEITGVPDGLYELVSECNWSGSLQELDRADNAASVLVRLAGGKAEVVEERGFYKLPM